MHARWPMWQKVSGSSSPHLVFIFVITEHSRHSRQATAVIASKSEHESSSSFVVGPLCVRQRLVFRHRWRLLGNVWLWPSSRHHEGKR